MKKLFKTIIIVLFTIVFMSCSNSIESDAKKVADIQCEVQDATKRVMQGDVSVQEEMQKLTAKLEKINNEMSKKYSSLEDKKKLARAVIAAVGNCNK